MFTNLAAFYTVIIPSFMVKDVPYCGDKFYVFSGGFQSLTVVVANPVTFR